MPLNTNIKTINTNRQMPLSHKRTLREVVTAIDSDISTAVDAVTPLTGTGQGNGNVIEKTLKGLGGGDFTTFAEFMEWLSTNTFDNAEVRLLVTNDMEHPCVPVVGDDESYWNIPAGRGISKLYIGWDGDDKVTFLCDINDYDGLFRIGAGAPPVYLERLQFMNVNSGDGVCFNVGAGGYLRAERVECRDFYSAVTVRKGAADIYNCYFYSSSGGYSGAGYIEAYGGEIRMWGGSASYIEDETLGNAWAISAYQGALITITDSFTIKDCAEAFHCESGGRILYTDGMDFDNNTADYNITLNEIQYDGSYISNGTSALSFKA
jgi:hypothetical protein